MLCVSNHICHHRQWYSRRPLLSGLGLEVERIWPDWKPDLPVIAVQAMFEDEQLLGDEVPLFNHWSMVCEMARRMGASRLVYSSPKLRQGSDITLALSRLDRMARMTNLLVCLEVLPAAYGCELFTSFEQASIFSCGRDWKLCLNTGAYILAGEDPEMIDVTQVGHVHVTEPLRGILDPSPAQIDIAEVLSDGEYTGHVTLGMPPCNPKQLERGIKFLKTHY